jgi:hypothetical protein
MFLVGKKVTGPSMTVDSLKYDMLEAIILKGHHVFITAAISPIGAATTASVTAHHGILVCLQD